MSVDVRWARTDEQIQLMQRARRQGEVCGWCGREFNLHETFYLERFLVGAPLDRRGIVTHRSLAFAPVGTECASPDLLDQTEGTEPEGCARCHRRVFYRSTRRRRSRAICSRRCGTTLGTVTLAERIEFQRQPVRTADSERWARTEPQIELVRIARELGGFCGWCGRVFDSAHTAYYDRFLIGEEPHPTQRTVHRTHLYAPVGVECASPELIAETAGLTPEPCGQCGRGVFFGHTFSHRRRTTCSCRCGQYLSAGRSARRKQDVNDVTS